MKKVQEKLNAIWIGLDIKTFPKTQMTSLPKISVRLIRCPVTGRLALSRLRFISCMPCARAKGSCAGTCETSSSSLCLPSARIHGRPCIATLSATIFCAQVRGFWWKLHHFLSLERICSCILNGFEMIFLKDLLVFAWVLRGAALSPDGIAWKSCTHA